MKRSVMFTTETVVSEPEPGQPPRERRRVVRAAAPEIVSRLTDPVWLARTLWARKGLIVLAAVVGAVLAALASLMVPPRYVSTAQLFIDPRDLRVLQNEVSPNVTGGDPTSITSYLESQARIIASDSIKTPVVQSLGLDKDPEFGGEAPRSGLSQLLWGWLPGRGASSRDGLVYALAVLDKNVSVRRGERTFVIDISVTAREADKAARIANALAETYLENQASVRADAAQRATNALTARLEELRNRLRTAEDKTERYKEANNIVGVGAGRSMTDEQLTLNNAQLVAARTRLTEARAKYDQISAARPAGIEAGAIPEAVASQTMTALRAQLGATLAREADLLASLGARHPALAAVQAQTRDARKQIADELSRISRSAKVELDRAIEAERQLSLRVERLTATQYAAGRASVELRELEREVESSRVVYDAFLRRARETGELAGIDTTNARVISAAMPPLEKSGISRRTLAVLGGVAGGGVGVALALGLALFGTLPRPAPRRAPEPAEPAVATGAPTPAPEAKPSTGSLMAVPPAASPVLPAAAPKAGWRRFVSIQGGQTERVPDLLRTAAAPLLANLPAVRHRRWRRDDGEVRSVFQAKTHLVDVLDKPNGGFAKAVRAVRTALAGGGPEPDRRRILVLGLRPDAGASTLALNLALDAALAGLPAMLVDAGAGDDSLTRVFAPDAAAGLHDIVTGRVGLVRAALQDEGTGLFFLPRVGRADQVPAQQIESGFLDRARRFGPIVIDGGAVGTDGLAQRFAEVADDIVLVLREGAVGQSDLATATAALGDQAQKLRGFVVNEA
ncbi:Wzz/FepE/Etk N-terminal domain-containing protein [Bosea sp. (in: a-proteobacteria)]|uniref:Wzz/FepE/Etk N-terminal domain-containing protein n=1 Tax=Bosea sp. (in: a-proteobacteria) TaxID=1871050 RepID=UPI002B4708CA|nr:Wzz/FepE/Etk N-terminal domain-containing protein [Bosea sp. (in: a-proteobacteria)]WRH56917.1 MAG: Wzz/FepE/Etk N-terminal domain-containing protein [Bosea sp. (in: a-proteobacteria)]